MKRLIFLLLLLALGFYVFWPAWSGYQIKTALDAGDAQTLSSKIDFASVKESLRPAAYAYAERYLDDTLKTAGPASTVIDDRTKKSLLPKVVDQSLDRLVTPDNMIRIAQQGGSVTSRLSNLVREQMGSMGPIPGLGNLSDLAKLSRGGSGGAGAAAGLGGLIGAATKGKVNLDGLGGLIGGKKKTETDAAPAAPSASPAAEAKDDGGSIGLSNIKSVGFAGPLGLQVSVAKDGTSESADLTAEMGFRDLDWKLVALRPRLP